MSCGMVPVVLLLVAMAVSPGQMSAQIAGGNDIYNFSAVDVSGTEMRVTVGYTYAGDRPLDEITLVACALQSDERQAPGTACEHVPIYARSGKETIDVTTYGPLGQGGGVTSTMVEVCLYVEFGRFDRMHGEDVYCERFPWTKAWTAGSGDSSSDAAVERPEILSFSATPANVLRGGAVTLRWKTSNADRTWIVPNGGEFPGDWDGSGLDRTDKTVPASGHLGIRPDRSTSYTLLARNRVVGGEEVSRTVRVSIEGSAQPPPPPPPPRTCSISGRVTGKLRVTIEDPQGVFTGQKGRSTFVLKEMGLFAKDFRELLIRKPVSVAVPGRGRFEFLGVPAGTYGLAPVGGHWNYSPRGKVVTCTPGGSLKVDFNVTGIRLES